MTDRPSLAETASRTAVTALSLGANAVSDPAHRRLLAPEVAGNPYDLVDLQARTVSYLRISVTDRCNYRCAYCMPVTGVDVVPRADLLSFDELERLTRLFVSLGVRRVRLTGGEPLVRRGIADLVARLAAVPGVEDLAMTTNGHLLGELAADLRRAGLQRLNVSIDTLDPKRFAELTRQGDVAAVLNGLQSAQSALGYLPRDAMQTIARHLVVPPALIEGVASFYAQFRFDKPGRHRVTVCSGTACYVRGSGKLMADMQADLKIVPGGTTADGEISLESVSCFGACALAPVVVVDDKVLRQQTTVSLKKVIDEVTAGSERSRTRATRSAPAKRGASK